MWSVRGGVFSVRFPARLYADCGWRFSSGKCVLRKARAQRRQPGSRQGTSRRHPRSNGKGHGKDLPLVPHYLHRSQAPQGGQTSRELPHPSRPDVSQLSCGDVRRPKDEARPGGELLSLRPIRPGHRQVRLHRQQLLRTRQDDLPLRRKAKPLRRQAPTIQPRRGASHVLRRHEARESTNKMAAANVFCGPCRVTLPTSDRTPQPPCHRAAKGSTFPPERPTRH